MPLLVPHDAERRQNCTRDDKTVRVEGTKVSDRRPDKSSAGTPITPQKKLVTHGKNAQIIDAAPQFIKLEPCNLSTAIVFLFLKTILIIEHKFGGNRADGSKILPHARRGLHF